MDDGKLKKAIGVFLKNPYWKEYYETAPSEECKEYIEHDFYFSLFGGSEEIEKRDKELEDLFSVDDWKHLAKYAGNNPFKGKCRKKIRELEAAGE